MRCPKCNALAADSDPRCLWCDTRLSHTRIAPPPSRRSYSRGYPAPQEGPGYDRVGMALGMVGMFVGMVVAAGGDLVKPALAGVVCCGAPFLGVWVLVRLVGRSR